MMKRIDSHIHLIADAREVDLMNELDMRVLNICVAEGDWRKKHAEPYSRLARQYPDRFAWVTSFTLPWDGETGEKYVKRQIEQLEADFADGALGCKVWKNVGMELKDPAGRHILVDDPMFEPIFHWLEDNRKPTLMHIGEPKTCWEPLVPGIPPHHLAYYSENPQWHMHGRTDMPSYAQLIQSRDNVIARHPKLRVIGAHYGSMEHDVREVARRFEQFPNFAVDTSARLIDAAWQDREIVREFCLKYPDRVLWGSDMVVVAREDDSEEKRAARRKTLRDTWALEWAFFATDDEVPMFDRKVRGLGLPEATLKQMFHDSVRQWYPGL